MAERSTTRAAVGAGVGLRLPHLEAVAAARPAARWFEIHPETFLANPHALELLLQVAEHYPISVHTVGVSIGSAHGVDATHLERVRELVHLIDPVLVSGHLAWSTHPGAYLNDLLPLPYTEATLEVLVRHLEEVQEVLGRPYLLENPASYVGYRDSTMTEPELLAALVERAGCRLLCDVSNIYVSSRNLGFDPRAYLDGLPAGAVAEIHLGGFAVEDDDGQDRPVLVDTHGTPITEPVWALYKDAVERFGPCPTLIEWDNDLPSLDALLAEAARADREAAVVARAVVDAPAR